MIPDQYMPVLYSVLYLMLAPLAGGLITGIDRKSIDRKMTARLPGRVGPPIIQPFYNIGKIFWKENPVVTITQNFYLL